MIHAVLACRLILHIQEQVGVQRQRNLNQEGLSYASADLLVSGEDLFVLGVTAGEGVCILHSNRELLLQFESSSS